MKHGAMFSGSTSASGRLSSVLSVALLTVATLAGCSWLSGLPTLRFDSPFGETDWIELRDATVVIEPSPALAVTLVNQKDVNLSVRFEIDEIEGSSDCANSFRLSAGQKFWYSCPQPFVAAGRRYRVDIQVYKDLGQTKLAERIQRLIQIETGANGALVLVGQPVK